MKKHFYTLVSLVASLLLFQQNTQAQFNLNNYVRIGRYDLPEPTRTTAPPNNLLAQEVSAVTYNWDTETLFVVGDGGTAIVQVSKTGQLINSMTLAQGSSPQGTEFYDPEGLSYIGNGKFVMSEERDRQIVLFTYVAGSTLTRANAQTVKLGTFVQNIGIEGLSYDPLTSGYICVKEIQPLGIFQTGIDFDAGTATNGSPTTENSVDLFNPSLTTLPDFADIFALSTLSVGLDQAFDSSLLVLSQESGQVVHITRQGQILGILNIASDPGNPLTVAAQQHEGITMDRNGYIYIVSENGGGGFDFPQLWVYAPATSPNMAPTSINLSNPVNSIPENTNTLSPIKIADIVIADDGLGTNNITLSGPDTSFFQVTSNSLFLKAGTVLDFESKTSYTVNILVDDSTVGLTPDLSLSFTLQVTDIPNESGPNTVLIISEVAPWSSGNSPVGADWFEVTNIGTNAVDITGWKMDDNSNSFATSVALSGITSIAPGESVIFIESSTPSTVISAFRNNWFGTGTTTVQIGTYSGSGVGLSTGGDAVNLFNATGQLQASVSFGASPAGPYATFNNGAGINNNTISSLSVVGVNGAYIALNSPTEIGSPGTIGSTLITEVAPWSSGNSPVAADWFEITNTRAIPIDITGWKIDDNSGSPAAAVLLNGITTIKPGESVIFIESGTPTTTTPLFLSTWFGSNPPAGLQVGTYSGGGVGLGTGGDAVNIYNSAGSLRASVLFGSSPASAPFRTFDNAIGLNNTTISALSQLGINGAFAARNNNNEIGSPGRIINPACSPTTSTTSITTCDSLVWNAVTYRNSGTYTFVTTNAGGCDSTATLILTINKSTKSIDSVVANTRYTWNGETFTISGTYSKHFFNAAGCDSTATLVLQINPNQAPTVQISSPTIPAVFEAGSTVIVESNASDADGTIKKVELWVDQVLYKVDSVSPFTFTNPKVPAGSFSVKLKAYDDLGAVGVSDSLFITVTACTPNSIVAIDGFTNISGSAVADLQANPSYPANPSVKAVLTQFFEYRNVADNYGSRIKGFFCAPSTGLYRFSIASDDQAGFWLSTDNDSANKVLVAYNLSPTGFRTWNKFSTQQSDLIELVGGASYYFEVLHKEAVGSDYLSIGVTYPNGVFEGPVRTSQFTGTAGPGTVVLGTTRFAESMEKNSITKQKHLNVLVAPNPSVSVFTLNIRTTGDASINLRVFDVAGRLVEFKSGIGSNSTVQVGAGLKAGIYFVEVVQGELKQRIKLIKQ